MITTRSPYRISFFGGGTDYEDWYSNHGGGFLSFAINYFTYITLRIKPKFQEKEYRVLWRLAEEVKNIVQECQSCELHKTRNMSVFGEGNENAQIMFIGEAPGKDEDMTGQPFIGRAGQLLDRIIQAMKMKREDIYICNTVKCRPEDNRKPTVDEVKSCSSFLDFQIKKVNPEIIICLG